MANSARAFLAARFGDRFTAAHYVAFLVVFLLLTISYERLHIAGNVAAGIVGEPGISTHPHQVLFPWLLAALGLKKSGWWLLYPALFLVVFPALWLYLAKRFN